MFEERDLESLSGYVLSEEQVRFTAMPLDALVKVGLEEERFPVVIEAEGRVVGFFVLHVWPGPFRQTDNERAVLLRGYSIRDEEQGKGFGRGSLVELPSFVRSHFPGVNEVVLSVNKMNEHAAGLYLRSGFCDTGREISGKIGPQFVFSMSL